MNLRPRSAILLCALAGACDGLTGLLLLAAPCYTLGLMHLKAVPAEPIYMRWIGIFVFSVGCSYFLPLLTRRADVFQRRLVSVFEVTALIRTCVALFVGAALLTGKLEAGWFSVVFTDAALAAIQIVMLNTGALEPATP